MATNTEVERKYDVPVDFAVPDLTGVRGVALVDEPAEHRLDATYYDTPRLRLASRQVTLRRRHGGDDAGWHLKRPAEDGHAETGDRTETQLPLDGYGREVPPALVTQVRALSRGEPLAPVAHVRTRRLERPLRDADGTVLALLADDMVSSEAMGEKAVIQEWRELEVELVDGSRPVLDALDAALRAAGALPAKAPSKLARALAGRYPGRERHDHGAVTDYLRRQRDRITDNDPGVRDGDPEAVHDMRVATRRLRSTLRTFRPLLDADRSEPLRAELRWLGAELGAVRDGHVMAERLTAAIAAEPPELVVGPVAARIRGRLGARTAEARERLVATFDGPRYAALLDAIDQVVDLAPANEADPKRLRRLAGKALRRADKRLDAVERAGSDRDVRLHDARKAYKRARYAVEAVSPLAGKPARKLAKRLAALQDVLGAHQDSIATSQLLRDYGMRAYLDGDNAFTYGLLHARQREAGERVLDGLNDARRRAEKPKIRRWIER